MDLLSVSTTLSSRLHRSTRMLSTSIVGFSRIGPNRELKKTIEDFWKNSPLFSTGTPPAVDDATLISTFENQVNELQIQRWNDLKATGLDVLPSNDFSLYDQTLDAAFLFGIIPDRYRQLEDNFGHTQPSVLSYFAMARGYQVGNSDVPALPMKKWFDTNCTWISL